MNFRVKSGTPDKLKSPCLIVGVYAKGKLSPSAEQLDAAADGALSKAAKGGDIKGEPGDTLMLHRPAGLACERLLLVGLGKADEITDTVYRKALTAALRAVAASPAKEAVSCLLETPVKERDLDWKAQAATEALGNAIYRFDQLKTAKDKEKERPALSKLVLLTADKGETDAVQAGAARGAAIAKGVAFAKDLANLPGNICTPTYLAEQALELGKAYKSVKASVLEEEDMEKLGMGALLSVSRGSRQPAKLITIEYSGGKKKQKPVVLVGKGLTFDAGGISLKPAASMDEMKYDMGGAAGVLGTLKAVAELGLPINVVGVIPSSENLPDGAANKPGDIVTSMSGQTIEVLNTDAEGRLILCDALTYSKKFDPEVVIDLATLTGACVVALGKHASGLLGNDQCLVEALLAAGTAAGDRAWQMPLWDDYQEQLKSPFADMANIGGRDAGTITAACFLSRYTKDYTWAHLDIAGTAWLSGAEKGATGRPVPLLTHYLVERAAL